MLGVIFRKAQNKIQDPAKLRRLIVDLIDKEKWTGLDADVKGDAYEGLLEKNAAGHQGRRRPVLHAAAADPGDGRRACGPQPGETICDPACGTGGFLLAAHDYIAEHTTSSTATRSSTSADRRCTASSSSTASPACAR